MKRRALLALLGSSAAAGCSGVSGLVGPERHTGLAWLEVKNRAPVAHVVDLELTAGETFEHAWRVDLDGRAGDSPDGYYKRLGCVWRHTVGPYTLRATYDGVDGWTTLDFARSIPEDEVVGVVAYVGQDPEGNPSGDVQFFRTATPVDDCRTPEDESEAAEQSA